MTAAEQKVLRLAILRWCQGRGITLALAVTYARGEGFIGANLAGAVKQELEYLCDPAKGLLRAVASPAEPNDPRYQITAAGRDLLTSEEA